MRALFFLLLALLLALLWRNLRAKSLGGQSKSSQSTPAPREMVSCDWCHVHVVQTDAVAGERGVYCCRDHQRQAER